MSFIWSEHIDPVLSRGIFLDDLGVRNWALSREDAIHAIYEFEAIGVAILGGDVYQFVGEKAEQTYDSWYCEQGLGESDFEFFKRSLDVAKSYINNYLVPERLFALVPQV